jgi:hypothetical protein
MGPTDRIKVSLARRTTPAPWLRVYVGRPSPLGNPYPASDPASMVRYGTWLATQLDDPNTPQAAEIERLVALLNRGERLSLACYCRNEHAAKPGTQPCHGDAIRAVLVERAKS